MAGQMIMKYQENEFLESLAYRKAKIPKIWIRMAYIRFLFWEQQARYVYLNWFNNFFISIQAHYQVQILKLNWSLLRESDRFAFFCKGNRARSVVQNFFNWFFWWSFSFSFGVDYLFNLGFFTFNLKQSPLFKLSRVLFKSQKWVSFTPVPVKFYF